MTQPESTPRGGPEEDPFSARFPVVDRETQPDGSCAPGGRSEAGPVVLTRVACTCGELIDLHSPTCPHCGQPHPRHLEPVDDGRSAASPRPEAAPAGSSAAARDGRQTEEVA